SISGNLVISLTSRTGTPASRSALAVPPVEISPQPSLLRPLAKSMRPVLSETESKAVGISNRNPGFDVEKNGDHFNHAGIDDVLDAEHAGGEHFCGVVRL